MRMYAQRGLAYEAILEEIEEQRPFNTGSTEARHIRNRSHPLFAIETAVQSLSGLPSSFSNRISAFATEFEVEYFVLGAIDDGLHDDEAIREYVLSNVRSLSHDDKEAVSEGVDRLIDKQILERDSDSLDLRLTQ
jgi:hypothetical protein